MAWKLQQRHVMRLIGMHYLIPPLAHIINTWPGLPECQTKQGKFIINKQTRVMRRVPYMEMRSQSLSQEWFAYLHHVVH
jgi:hypothetical protein